MRKSSKKLNQYLQQVMKDFRHRNKYTQEYMAECLHIATRSYQAQEAGKVGFGGQTICRFLVLLPVEERLHFTSGIEDNVWNDDDEEDWED